MSHITLSILVTSTSLPPKKRQHVLQAVRMLEKRGAVLPVTPANATEAAHVLERLAALLGEGSSSVAVRCRVCGTEQKDR